MERIGPNAFAGRTGLRDVTFPSTLTEIGEYAFESCPIHLVSLPSSLKKLGEDSFDCLSRYYNPRKNPQELRIGPGGPIEADGDAVYQVDGESKTLVRAYGPRFSVYYHDYEDYDGEAEAVLSRYTVAEGTTAIARGAFENCSCLLCVTLPDTLRENAAGAAEIVIEYDDLAGLNTLAELGVFTGENIDGLIELANASRKPEILSCLMNYKNAEIGITETNYEL